MIPVFFSFAHAGKANNDSVHQQGNKTLFHAKLKIHTCTVCEICFSTEEENGIRLVCKSLLIILSMQLKDENHMKALSYYVSTYVVTQVDFII